MDVKHEKVQVKCYSGFKANERPTAFTHQGRHHEIAEILDRWFEGGLDPSQPKTDYFKIKTMEGDVFLLRYLSLSYAWAVRI